MDFMHVTVSPSDGSLMHYTQRSTLDPTDYDRTITVAMAHQVAESIMFAFDSIRVSFYIGDRRYEVERVGICHAMNDTGCREHAWDEPLAIADRDGYDEPISGDETRFAFD